MLLALIFGQRDGHAHAKARLDAFHRAVHPQRALHAKPRAEIGAHPKQILGFDEHSADADIPGASFECCRTPLDLQRSLIAITRRPAAFAALRFRVPNMHGPGTPPTEGWRANVEPLQRARSLKIRWEPPRKFDTKRACFVPAIWRLDTNRDDRC